MDSPKQNKKEAKSPIFLPISSLLTQSLLFISNSSVVYLWAPHVQQVNTANCSKPLFIIPPTLPFALYLPFTFTSLPAKNKKKLLHILSTNHHHLIKGPNALTKHELESTASLVREMGLQ